MWVDVAARRCSFQTEEVQQRGQVMLAQLKRVLLVALVAVLASCGGSILDEASDSLKGHRRDSDGPTCMGKTIGFWGNRIGIFWIDSGDLAYLESFRLVDRRGTVVHLTTPREVSWFLRGASAKRMANMLSAQWVAFALNYQNDFFCRGLDVTFRFEGFPEPGEGPDGTVTFDQIADAVAAALAEGSGATREEMEFLKDFLDAANNRAPVCACELPTGATGGTGGFSR
jgi:hypothetical protein